MHHPLPTSLLRCAVLGALVLLSGCADAPRSYGERMATAAAQGCWAGEAPTPLPVTVTLPGGRLPPPSPTVVLNPGVPTFTPGPTPTARPTTTPLPRCTPAPGTTLAPWPTPRPPAPPVPTRPADHRQPLVDGATILHLPNALLGLDLAVHPVQNWPLVAAIDIPVLNRDPARVYVRAYDPLGGGWGLAQTVDTAATHPGARFRSVAVGVTGDGALHAVWGVTDFPELALFASHSADQGRHWSAPARLGGGLFGVLDVATTLDNQVFALALQRDPELRPVLFHRNAAGHWGAPEPLPFAGAWYGSGGALVVAADGLPGHTAQLIALVTAGDTHPGSVALLRRPVAGGPWTTVMRQVGGDDAGLLPGAAEGLAFTWTQGAATAPGVTFTIPMRDAASVYALTSLDGGATWGMAEQIARSGRPSTGSDGTYITSAAPAYDPVAGHLLALWTCCADGLWGNTAATHYASWRPLTAPAWAPPLDPATFGARVPLVSGARAAGLTSAAQAANARVAWLAWVEDGQQVRVRTLRLDQVLPFAAYPTATPLPTPLRPPTTGRP